MRRKLCITLALALALIASLVLVLAAAANPPAPESGPAHTATTDVPLPPGKGQHVKPIDMPNAKDAARLRERWQLLESGQAAQANALAKTGTDRVLVILVDFAGTDVITWTKGTSTWDPYGQVDPDEAVFDADGNTVAGDCSNIITQTKKFTFTGPVHNQIPRPLSADDRSGDSVWTENFDRQWFQDFMFGNGVKFQYAREDGSLVNEDFTGKSVTNYYSDMSAGQYTVTGDVFGWLPLQHSTMWYGADPCPGRRSDPNMSVSHNGGISGAGSAKTLVQDALKSLNAISNTIPGFDWKNYDLDKDGVIDRLWIVHAGYGEEDGVELLNRTGYGEGSMWSHSSAIPPFQVAPGVVAGPYIMMPENGGIGVFAHESGHNLGVPDLYSYSGGETSAGFWTLMADDWTGYPIGFMPPAVDPLNLDYWGWLNPRVITDTSKVYEVTLGQASSYPGGEGMYRGAKIELPEGLAPLAVQPAGAYNWWGGKKDETNSLMTLKTPVALPADVEASLSFDIAYGIEPEWDFLWVQASDDGGKTWQTLTNANTTCDHDVDWIGEQNGFPADLCGAGIGGFTDYNASFPGYDNETFDLSAFAGKSVQIRFWYMTDWGTSYEGPFIDNVVIAAAVPTSGALQPLFTDDAEATDANWTYTGTWSRSNGTIPFTHNFYLQWRNTGWNGGYDASLGDSRWRFGPANTGLLVWYNNNLYTDNEIPGYLTDYPGYGPKGLMLVVDAHPEPYRDPYWVHMGYDNESSNLLSRSQMRDAPFSMHDTVPFAMSEAYGVYSPSVTFEGRAGTAAFHDALGYYPGAELKPGGPVGQTNPRWMTKQWDASAVIPARDFYGIKAPGYTATDVMRFWCDRNGGGQVLCYGYGGGLGYDGTSGNPAEFDAQYGWHARVIEEAPDGTWARVRIWNSRYGVDDSLRANVDSANAGDEVTYTYDVQQLAGSRAELFVVLQLDNARVSYVPGSASQGLTPIASGVDPETVAQAFASGGEEAVRQLASAQYDETTMLIAWPGRMYPGESGPKYSFKVTPRAVNGDAILKAYTFNTRILKAAEPSIIRDPMMLIQETESAPLHVNGAPRYYFPTSPQGSSW